MAVNCKANFEKIEVGMDYSEVINYIKAKEGVVSEIFGYGAYDRRKYLKNITVINEHSVYSFENKEGLGKPCKLKSIYKREV